MRIPICRPLIPPLRSADFHRGWLYAFLGAAVVLPSFPVAVLAAAAVPTGFRAAAFVAVLAVLTAAFGSLRLTRRASVRLANRLLGTDLPAPGGGSTGRARTALWLFLHTAVGCASTAVAGFALMTAVMLPAVWLRGGERVTVLVPVEVAGGPQGLWTLPVSGALLLAACHIGAAAAALLRRLAPPLLGHRPDERLAALEEQTRLLAQRNRLAQELHDSIGHTMTASTIQAALARELMDSDPAAARRALTGLEEASRAALDDLDHVLGILRDGRAPTAPQFGLTDLHALLERVRSTGMDLSADITGDLTRVPATISREAYRIVQEGLTNALKHAAGTRVELRVTAGPGSLDIEITNPYTGRSRRRRGHGLTGIAERVALLRGESSAGPSPDGTCWRLGARIPLRSAS
ncbi:sensor histidine kinase [Streptomyces blastmyceticus]|uniref:histidine kinase n=1 Tax=Streptomyces blastmyceticus TaxID=68180 RepID=A0ABP3HMG7_9ACTN